MDVPNSDGKKKVSRLQRKLDVKDFKLQAIQNIAKAINSNLASEELLNSYKTILQNPPLSIEKLLLFEKQDVWRCMMQFGVEGQIDEIAQNWFQDADEQMFFTTADGDEEQFDVLIPVHLENELIAYVIVGDVDDKARISPVIKHMNFIQTLTNLIIVAVKNRRMLEESLKQERVKKELELAAEMQAMLVPDTLPSDTFFDVSAIYRPHQQVGGDYYDFIELNENEVMFCMADVSGKGVSAAFLMSNFQAYLMAIFKYKELSLEEAVTELNERVMHSAKGEKYITFFVARYNKTNRMLNYINCGHNPPLLMAPSKEVEWLKFGSVGLGMFEEIPNIQTGSVKVESNSVIVCYTDGLVEVENEQLEEYGTERLEELVKIQYHSTMAELNSKIIQELNVFRESMPFVDDTAVLSCRFI
ncbi:MAG: PP2C family protein-serine/threonine phosphatase [Flavobacteriales bacterium]